jgi:hypothetical protein
MRDLLGSGGQLLFLKLAEEGATKTISNLPTGHPYQPRWQVGISILAQGSRAALRPGEGGVRGEQRPPVRSGLRLTNKSIIGGSQPLNRSLLPTIANRHSRAGGNPGSDLLQ